MSKIDDLIKQYCPNGVEYDIIENICRISRGRVMSKEYLRDNIGEYPVYSSQTINEGMLGKIDTYDYILIISFTACPIRLVEFQTAADRFTCKIHTKTFKALDIHF